MCYPQGRAGNLCKTPSASNLSVDGMPGVTPKLVTAAQKLLESMALCVRHKQTNKQTNKETNKQTNKQESCHAERKRNTCLKTRTITLTLDDSTTFETPGLPKAQDPMSRRRVGSKPTAALSCKLRAQRLGSKTTQCLVKPFWHRQGISLNIYSFLFSIHIYYPSKLWFFSGWWASLIKCGSRSKGNRVTANVITLTVRQRSQGKD